jgi:hypothetical protein
MIAELVHFMSLGTDNLKDKCTKECSFLHQLQAKQLLFLEKWKNIILSYPRFA